MNADVEAYLHAQPEPQEATLRQLREQLLRLVPRATEGMKYGMPALLLDGVAIAGYAGFSKHCGFYPMSGSVVAAAGDLLAAYSTSKGGFTFLPGTELPDELLSELLRIRLVEVSQPKLDKVGNGKVRTYYPDGTLESEGRIRRHERYGTWRFYAADGSLVREENA